MDFTDSEIKNLVRDLTTEIGYVVEGTLQRFHKSLEETAPFFEQDIFKCTMKVIEKYVGKSRIFSEKFTAELMKSLDEEIVRMFSKVTKKLYFNNEMVKNQITRITGWILE